MKDLIFSGHAFHDVEIMVLGYEVGRKEEYARMVFEAWRVCDVASQVVIQVVLKHHILKR